MADLQEPESQVDDIAADIRTAAEQVSAKIGGAESTEIPEADTRARDATGKFVKVEQQADAGAPEKPITDADRLTEQPAQPSRAVDGPPRGWSADEKALWAQLPPAIQTAVSRREQQASEGGRQWSDEKRSFEQALGPIQTLSQQYGISPAEVSARLVNVEKRLGDPGQAPQVIAELAQAYGVNLAALVNGSPQPQRQTPQFDPNIIPQIVDNLVTQRLTEREQDHALNSEISTFANARGADGQPLHPHFESVKALMGHLISSGQVDPQLNEAQTLQDAYEKAIWVNADTRPASAPPRPVAQGQQQVARARKAAVSVSGAPGGQLAKPKGFDADQSLADDIREAMQMVGRN